MLTQLSVVLKVIAGFFFLTAFSIAFMQVQGVALAFKLPFLGAVFLIGLTFLVGGLASNGFRAWKRDTGVVLLVASGVDSLYVFSIFCMAMTPELMQLMEKETLDVFSDYLTGSAVFIGQTLVGWLLFRSDQGQLS